MSTDYRTRKTIAFVNLFDGRLEEFGVREHIKADETSNSRRCLTDGRNYLWTYEGDEGSLGLITRWGGNAPDRIMRAISERFDTEIFSEYEHQFWGFDTEEEWGRAMENSAEEHEAEFYAQIIKHINGEPSGLVPGKVGMTQAEIAKGLVENDTSLLLPERQSASL